MVTLKVQPNERMVFNIVIVKNTYNGWIQRLRWVANAEDMMYVYINETQTAIGGDDHDNTNYDDGRG